MDTVTASAIAALKEQQKLAEERAAKRFAALEAENKKLKDGKAEQDRRVTDLEKRNKQQEKTNKLQAKEIRDIKGQLRELKPPAAELVFGWAKRWRMFMGSLGLVGPGLGLGSVLIKSKDALMASKMAWASFSFLVLSVTCLFTTAYGNVRNIGTHGEKALVCLCGLLFGAALYLPGYTLAGSEDEHTTYWGWLFMGLGVFWTIMGPPIACKVVSMRSQLEDQELSMAVIRLFKSLPSILPSMTYLAVASMRCILGADDESPVYQQCGNPILPSLTVNILLIMVWLMSYLAAPLMKETKAKTWVDIMVLRMGKMEAVEFGLLGLMSTFAWMLFATTNEDGEPMNLFMYSLVGLFICFWISLASVIVFDVDIKPLLFPSSATASDDGADTDGSATTTTSRTGRFSLGKMDAGLSGLT